MQDPQMFWYEKLAFCGENFIPKHLRILHVSQETCRILKCFGMKSSPSVGKISCA